MALANILIDSGVVSPIVTQLERLNTNFERLLRHMNVAESASPEAEAVAALQKTYIGEPVSELEQALREHAQLAGIDWKPNVTLEI